jgi:Putative transposase.
VSPTWRSCRPGFFLPVRVLSRVFRGKFLTGLRDAIAAGTLPEPSGGTAWWSGLYAQGMGRLQQAAVRRARAGLEIPGAVHASCGHQQLPGWWSCATAR